MENIYMIGFWKEDYNVESNDSFESLQSVFNTIDKNFVLNRWESLGTWLAPSVTEPDEYTGEHILFGFVDDGNFKISNHFMEYYKIGLVGLPKCYEDYLEQIYNQIS